MTASRRDGSPPEPLTVVSTVVVAGTHVRATRLAQLLEAVGVSVVGTSRSVEDAVTLVSERRPDTVLLDLALDAGGLDLVELVMGRRATPIVLTGAAADNAAAALAAGAVDVVAPGTERLGAAPYARALGRHLRVASRVRVITHPRGRLRERGLGTVLAAPAPPRVVATEQPSGPGDAEEARRARRRRPPIVVIGASTGGPPALAAVLGALPADLPAPVLVVQHMADGFVEGLAKWLDGVVPMPVSVALNGDRLRPGHVVLAPSDGNLVVEGGLRIRIEEPHPAQFHIPEIDRTLRSVAEVCRERAVGVLLTGMGRDGAAGMLALRRVGAFTIGQDERTSAVWGMPAAAAALDGLDVELPLPEISERILLAVERLCVPEAV
ncbi:MAG: response regulator [Frankiales bacterium]|nr:response regulator [Frankiales bacterium]